MTKHTIVPDGAGDSRPFVRLALLARLARLVLLVLLVLSPSPGCGDGAGGGTTGVDAAIPDARPFDGSRPDADPGLPPERSCSTEFSYRPASLVTTVQLAGEWDWTSPESMQPDGTGGYVLQKDLDQGVWAYKLIVDGDWILDPSNNYRKYHGGIENSGKRVGDCLVPLLELTGFDKQGSSVTARVSFTRANGGPDVDLETVRVTLEKDFVESAVAHAYAGRTVTAALDGLGPGKHVLRFEASDADGEEALPVTVPFWIEEEDFDWRDAVIYMVMLDRFRDGNQSNNPLPTAGAHPTADWHGGDLAGITMTIEEGYFDALGVRALWISPFVRNPNIAYDDNGRGVAGYHGYWPIRAREIDPRFGTEQELEALVSAAHARGIRILMDFVINHVHEEHEHYLAHPEWFRTGCICGTSGCDWTEHRIDCLFMTYMPDVNWEVHEASEAFIQDALWWLTRFDLDGLRVDAVKHVEDLAVYNLSIRVAEELERGGTEHFLLGETAMGWAGPNIDDNLNEYATISRYIGPDALNGQFDFVLYHAVSYNTFARDYYGLIHADYWTRASLEHYPEYAIMTPYIGSHDTQRFISLADPAAASVVYNKWPEDGLPAEPASDEPYGRLAVALAWVLNLPGAPLLYYGDEYGEFGGSDPDNRHMWRDETSRTPREEALFDMVSRIGSARASSPALRRGGYMSVLVEEQLMCFARYTESDTALVILNHSSAEAVRQIVLPAALPRPAAAFRDQLRPLNPAVPIIDDAIQVTVPPRSAVVLLPDL